MVISAVRAASETSAEEKRRAMGRVVGQAARDDATIDVSQVLLRALIDMGAPEFHALGVIAQFEDDADGLRAAVERVPTPVIARLGSNGVVREVGTYGGDQAVTGLTPFGRLLISFVFDAEE